MEKFMFIAFRSREHTVKFFEEMRSRGIVGTVIIPRVRRKRVAVFRSDFPHDKKMPFFRFLNGTGFRRLSGFLRQPPLTEKGLSVLRNQSSRRSS